MRGSRKDYPVRLHALVSGNVVIGTATALIMCKRRFSILRVWNCYDEDDIGTTRSRKRVMSGCKNLIELFWSLEEGVV